LGARAVRTRSLALRWFSRVSRGRAARARNRSLSHAYGQVQPRGSWACCSCAQSHVCFASKSYGLRRLTVVVHGSAAYAAARSGSSAQTADAIARRILSWTAGSSGAPEQHAHDPRGAPPNASSLVAGEARSRAERSGELETRADPVAYDKASATAAVVRFRALLAALRPNDLVPTSNDNPLSE
jgi:hypothetical protein